eukprot:scaffold172195_cov49-Prasinocladus_malaysianus.AAC.2
MVSLADPDWTSCCRNICSWTMISERLRYILMKSTGSLRNTAFVEPSAVEHAASETWKHKQSLFSASLSPSRTGRANLTSDLPQSWQYIKPRHRKLTSALAYLKGCLSAFFRDEEVELVRAFQRWKVLQKVGSELVRQSGRDMSHESLAQALRISGGAAELRRIERDAWFALREIESSYITIISQLAYRFRNCGMTQEDLIM